MGHDIPHVARESMALLCAIWWWPTPAQSPAGSRLPDEEANDVKQLAAGADSRRLLPCTRVSTLKVSTTCCAAGAARGPRNAFLSAVLGGPPLLPSITSSSAVQLRKEGSLAALGACASSARSWLATRRPGRRPRFVRAGQRGCGPRPRRARASHVPAPTLARQHGRTARSPTRGRAHPQRGSSFATAHADARSARGARHLEPRPEARFGEHLRSIVAHSAAADSSSLATRARSVCSSPRPGVWHDGGLRPTTCSVIWFASPENTALTNKPRARAGGPCLALTIGIRLAQPEKRRSADRDAEALEASDLRGLMRRLASTRAHRRGRGDPRCAPEGI